MRLGADSSQIDLNQYASDSRDLPGGRRSNDNLQEMLRNNLPEESKHYSNKSQDQRRITGSNKNEDIGASSVGSNKHAQPVHSGTKVNKLNENSGQKVGKLKLKNKL